MARSASSPFDVGDPLALGFARVSGDLTGSSDRHWVLHAVGIYPIRRRNTRSETAFGVPSVISVVWGGVVGEFCSC